MKGIDGACPRTRSSLVGLGQFLEEVRCVVGAVPGAKSLNRPLSSEEDGSEVGELVEDRGTPDPAGEEIRGLALARLREAAEQLPERHRHMLVRRYRLARRRSPRSRSSARGWASPGNE